jgi:hypothetical protein
MSCLPNAPVAFDVRDDGWQSFNNILTTTAAQWKPISTEVIRFDGVVETESQAAILRQLEIEETASTQSNLRFNDLMIYLYTQAAPTAPTEGAVYNPSTANLVAQVRVNAADYTRTSDVIWRALVHPNVYFKTGTGNTAGTLYGVALYANQTPTAYAASADIKCKVHVENCAIV